MSAREPGNGFRDWLGGLLSRASDWLLYGQGHELILRDADGAEILNVCCTGGFISVGPPEPYTLECCEEIER